MPDGEVDLADGARVQLVPADSDYAAAIVRREPDGSVTWRVLPPEGPQDAWVRVRLSGDEVVANSWSCWLVHVEILTGAVIQRVFTE
jgi:hypothetical protein